MRLPAGNVPHSTARRAGIMPHMLYEERLRRRDRRIGARTHSVASIPAGAWSARRIGWASWESEFFDQDSQGVSPPCPGTSLPCPP